MTDYIATLRVPVEKHAGVVADLAGDGLICYWLADSDPIRARTQALTAALEMFEGVRGFNARYPGEMLPTRFGIPHPETMALLEKLGSPNSHNCRSDQCLVAPKEDVTGRRPAEPKVEAKPATKEPGKGR